MVSTRGNRRENRASETLASLARACENALDDREPDISDEEFMEDDSEAEKENASASENAVDGSPVKDLGGNKKRRRNAVDWTEVGTFATVAEATSFQDQLAQEASITHWIKGQTYRGNDHTFVDYRCDKSIAGCEVKLRVIERGGKVSVVQVM